MKLYIFGDQQGMLVSYLYISLWIIRILQEKIQMDSTNKNTMIKF